MDFKYILHPIQCCTLYQNANGVLVLSTYIHNYVATYTVLEFNSESSFDIQYKKVIHQASSSTMLTRTTPQNIHQLLSEHAAQLLE